MINEIHSRVAKATVTVDLHMAQPLSCLATLTNDHLWPPHTAKEMRAAEEEKSTMTDDVAADTCMGAHYPHIM